MVFELTFCALEALRDKYTGSFSGRVLWSEEAPDREYGDGGILILREVVIWLMDPEAPC